MLVKAADHDFQPTAKLTPYGILLPDHNRAFLYFTSGPVTSDFIVDCLLDCWSQIAPDFPAVQTLVLLQDNGPENHSRRTQFMQRITQLADQLQLTVHLLYYPPYHSKYNPIERVGWLGAALEWRFTGLRHRRTQLRQNHDLAQTASGRHFGSASLYHRRTPFPKSHDGPGTALPERLHGLPNILPFALYLLRFLDSFFFENA
ncbi:MAG: hypothetical protein U0350_48230 [Caldilineaceae bacterium]